ncbi:CMRF35-like molecule 5 [Mastacembelus armatus]|uniref:CMRF35-like molecule 5 n=1 Tax=Mastacembelus armatus TaxID=205130 RepID=UPI000E45C0C5|nr:CMRF35-like molecule 5 [Mastacembelus armatus]
MIIHEFVFLLSALTVVQMKSLHITGHVGKNVTISCSNWNSWTDVNSKAKYFCVSPCNDKDFIIKAASGESKKKDRIHVTNTKQYLNVTFTDLQISDSKQYYCGLEVFGLDTLIEVTLEVTNGPQTTAQTVTVKSAVSLAGTNSSTVSSSSSNMIDSTPISHNNLNTTAPTVSSISAAGIYLIIGFLVIITVLMFLLKLMMKMKKQQKVSSPDLLQEQNVEYAEVQPEDHQTESSPIAVSTVHFSTDDSSDTVYANTSYHQDNECDKYSNAVSLRSDSSSEGGPRSTCRITDPQSDFYSLAEIPTKHTEPTVVFGQSESDR